MSPKRGSHCERVSSLLDQDALLLHFGRRGAVFDGDGREIGWSERARGGYILRELDNVRVALTVHPAELLPGPWWRLEDRWPVSGPDGTRIGFAPHIHLGNGYYRPRALPMAGGGIARTQRLARRPAWPDNVLTRLTSDRVRIDFPPKERNIEARCLAIAAAYRAHVTRLDD